MALRFGPFEIDERTYELRHQGRSLRPSRLVFDTILFLTQHSPGVVTKEQLIAGPWRGQGLSPGAAQRRAVAAGRIAVTTLEPASFQPIRSIPMTLSGREFGFGYEKVRQRSEKDFSD